MSRQLPCIKMYEFVKCYEVLSELIAMACFTVNIMTTLRSAHNKIRHSCVFFVLDGLNFSIIPLKQLLLAIPPWPVFHFGGFKN